MVAHAKAGSISLIAEAHNMNMALDGLGGSLSALGQPTLAGVENI
jgi:hypothetical protein